MPEGGRNSDHSLFDATGLGAASAVGRGRGIGCELRPAWWLLALVPVTWFSQVLKSCTSMDRRDGGSVGGPLVAACAAGAKTDNKKNREKLVLATLAVIVFTPRSACQMAHYEATRN